MISGARHELKRSLSFPLIAFYALGTILGAGIYALVGKVAGPAGLYAPVSFLVAAAVAALTGLSYAELAARLPRSAGAALYVHHAFPWRALAVVVGLLVMLTGIVSAATLANAFVGYLEVFFAAPRLVVITVLVVAMGALSLWGIGESVRVAAAITLIELMGLAVVLAAGVDSLATLPARWHELVPPVDAGVWQGIVLGGFLAFYAYIGFEDTANVAEEVQNPQRNLPRAILLSLALATVLYVAVALVAVLSLPLNELTGSNAPLALVYERTSGRAPTFVALISLFAVVNGAMIQIIMAARVLYGMSREGWLPGFARLHPRTRTPWVATGVVIAAVLAFALGSNLVMLAKITSFVILVVFAGVNSALLRVKLKREPAPAGVRSYSVAIPIAGVATTVALIAVQTLSLLRAA